MSWTVRAGLAAAVMTCAMSNGFAAPEGAWLTDEKTQCSLFSAGAGPGDTVTWTGDCVEGYAQGLGTATFTHDGQTQSFTADFTRGVIPDGHVISRWGQGWSYDGEQVKGVFNGAGILTTDTSDRFEGQWSDGKMNGFGVLRRANGEIYSGDWKDDKPNGEGALRQADGTLIKGTFVDGKLTQAAEKMASGEAQPVKLTDTPKPAENKSDSAPFGNVSGKTLTWVDGSSIALNLIEGGMELQVMPAGSDNDANARKTTFTFMTDRMGTVVEDSGTPGAGTSVTGFFRLTAKGVEVRYADGRSAMLTATSSESGGDGGVQMALDGDHGPSCRAWYPAGHAFSETEKKAALNAYASKLGLPVTAGDTASGCSAAPKPQARNETVTPPANAPTPKARPERHAEAIRPEIKSPVHMTRASYHVGDYKGGLDTVAVKTSEIHTIDGGAVVVPSAPSVKEAMTAAMPVENGSNDAAHCLKVDSDGSHWGFRNSCGFAVQFAYCMAGGDDSLTACGKDVTTSVAGSVAANGFGALMADTSLKDTNASHNFRWIACGGGAGEVVAHLEHAEPVSGRCERTRTAAN
jgi:hypothetical protein